MFTSAHSWRLKTRRFHCQRQLDIQALASFHLKFSIRFPVADGCKLVRSYICIDASEIMHFQTRPCGPGKNLLTAILKEHGPEHPVPLKKPMDRLFQARWF